MSVRKLGWGILGTAQIARKNWRAIQNSGNSAVVAVASRDLERSRRFIQECQAEAPAESSPLAFGRYEDLLASEAVQAVYTPLPTGLRREWVLRAAAAGKHIVCEKPCAVNAAELREMLEACRHHRVQFMDGVMFMHSRRLARMREVLDDGLSVGSIRRITSAFSFCAPPEFFASNIRAHSALEPHGCLGDLGWYCLRFALWAMGWKLPRQVIGRVLSQFSGDKSVKPIPTEFSAELLFEDGVSAAFYCSFLTENQQWAMVSGQHGYLRLEDFVLPFAGEELLFEVQQAVFGTRGGDFRMEPHSRRFAVSEPSHGQPGSQEANLFRNFSEPVLSGRLNHQWPELALKTQIVMDACLASARQDGRPFSIAGS
ncbi:MAG TPA: Gfo/Idh/MocA family oxidoreductase [Candidatus Binatia bacterium]|jgi:predicted dehydrogenase|nr:Gfo/Idh/MocA family oxidoreductase [Candidatus Binatia bacterium]